MSRKKTPEATAKTREEIITATARMFLRDGYAGATMKTIAGEAGCTTGKLYSNFSGKEDIFFRIAENIERIEMEASCAAAPDDSSEFEVYLISCVMILEVCRLNANLRELYNVCYTKPMTIKMVVDNKNKYLRKGLAEYGIKYDENEMFLRGLCAAGIIGSFIAAESITNNMDFCEKARLCLERISEVYGVSSETSDELIRRIEARMEAIHDAAYSIIIKLLQDEFR